MPDQRLFERAKLFDHFGETCEITGLETSQNTTGLRRATTICQVAVYNASLLSVAGPEAEVWAYLGIDKGAQQE